MVLTGPVPLVQGGQGLVGRFPVFTGNDSDRRFWGLISAVVDIDRLYHDSGLLDDRDIDIALAGQDSPDEASVQFSGGPASWRSSPCRQR